MNPDFIKVARVLSPEAAKQIVNVLDSLPPEHWSESVVINGSKKSSNSPVRTNQSLSWGDVPTEAMEEWKITFPEAIIAAGKFFMQELFKSNPSY